MGEKPIKLGSEKHQQMTRVFFFKTKKKLWLLLLADFVASPAPQMHSSLNLLNINIYNNCNKSSTGNLGEWGNAQQMAKIQKMFYGGDQYENLCAILGFVA